MLIFRQFSIGCGGYVLAAALLGVRGVANAHTSCLPCAFFPFSQLHQPPRGESVRERVRVCESVCERGKHQDKERAREV